MHSFVVVVAKPERHIPTDSLQALQQPDTPDLAFAPHGHAFWTDDARRVAVAGWYALTKVGNVGSYWHTDNGGLTAFAGRMWPKGSMWQRGSSWAEQLARHWQRHSVADRDQQLDGVFVAVSVSRAGAGLIVSDPLSIAMIYRAESDDFVAYSTSPRLAARAVEPPGGEPDRDPLGVAWLPFTGWIVGDRTGYVSTRVLPIGAVVDISPSYGSRIRYTNPTPWASDLPSDEAELIDLVHHDLSAVLRGATQLSAPARSADITGGKDSRLVLALMLQEGLTDEFSFRTFGYVHSPDALVGQAIARKFRLEHEHEVPQPMTDENFRQRLATHAFQTCGMFSAWEFKGGLSASSTLKFAGCIGEALRGKKNYPALPTLEDLRREFHGRSGLKGNSILQGHVRSELLRQLDADLLYQIDAGGSTPQDQLDCFYVRQRLRRWFGTYEELGEAGRVFPLYSVVGLQAAFALGPKRRKLEAVHFGVMRQACPELAKTRFADAGWSAELLSSLPDADDYRAAPVRHTGTGPAPTQWRPQRLLDNLDVARDLLLDDKRSPLYDILNRNAVVRILRRPSDVRPQECRQLFGGLAAAVWLARLESPDRIRTAGSSSDQIIERTSIAPTTPRPHESTGIRQLLCARVVPLTPNSAPWQTGRIFEAWRQAVRRLAKVIRHNRS